MARAKGDMFHRTVRVRSAPSAECMHASLDVATLQIGVTFWWAFLPDHSRASSMILQFNASRCGANVSEPIFCRACAQATPPHSLRRGNKHCLKGRRTRCATQK